MSLDGRVRPRRGARAGKDPWRGTPVGELEDPVLPRWFVLTALALVVLAVAALAAALTAVEREQLPVAARRPPPAGGLTNAVGAYRVGTLAPVPAERLCPTLAGVRVAGGPVERDALASGLRALCAIRLNAELAGRLQAFARAGGVVRFAQFEATGVDSTAEIDADPPRILINARFSRTDPAGIAPLIAHDATLLRLDPAAASSALAARAAEARVCERLFAASPAPSGCADARALLSLDDPEAALRRAGFSGSSPGSESG